MSRYSNIPKKALAPGDKVLVYATVTEISDDDPHDPSIVVWFNGASHVTTVMNVRRDTESKPITRSSWGAPVPVATNEFVRADYVVDVRPGLETVDDLLDLVETPTDEPEPKRTGRIAPPNQHAVMDGRRGRHTEERRQRIERGEE